MNILGHGVDIVSMCYFRKLLEESESNFTDRVFTFQELKDLPEGPTRIEKIAGQYAAKEAVLKAIGTGYGNGIAFTDITIKREQNNPPQVILSGKIAKVAKKMQIEIWHLSISHTEETVIASAIACSTNSQ